MSDSKATKFPLDPFSRKARNPNRRKIDMGSNEKILLSNIKDKTLRRDMLNFLIEIQAMKEDNRRRKNIVQELGAPTQVDSDAQEQV
jgi:hypothetical protein